MAQSTVVQVSGAIAAQPAAGALFTASLQEFLSLSTTATYGAAKGGAISVNSTDIAPFVVPLEGIVKGRMIGIGIISGQTVKVLLTTALGTDQAIPVSDKLFLHMPSAGDEYTALKIVGVADIQYFLAGDVS